jgi:hypothetical protein
MAARLLSVRDARHKLVMRIEPGAIEELYDLQTDPGERQPLPVGTHNEDRIPLLRAARKHIRDTAEAKDVVAQLKLRLRDVRVELQQIRS